jgi:tetratricopeptide (TPR) repeat protein
MTAPQTLITAMLSIQRERRSGIFHVGGDTARTHLYFDAGKLVFAEQGSLGDTLGRLLVRTGKLTGAQYVTALRSMTQRLIDNEQLRFGEVVVELGFLTSDQVLEALAEQVLEKVIHCLMLERPESSFEERQDPVALRARFPTPVEPAVLAATKRLSQGRLDRILEPARDRCPRIVEDAVAIANRFRLNGPEQRFVARLDASQTTLDLVAGGGLDPARSAVLAALLQAGCVELLEPKSRSWTAAPAVEVAKGAVHDAPVEKPDPPPREPPAVGPSPADRVRAEIALKRFADRHATKLQTVSVATPLRAIQAPLDPRAARLHAEDAFQSGRSHLRDDMPDRALPYLRRAVDLCPEATEFQLCLRWGAWITLDREARERDTAQREMLRLATQLVEEQPEVGFSYYVLGQLARSKGDDEQATKLFRRALAFDPDLTDAARQLRLARTPRGVP